MFDKHASASTIVKPADVGRITTITNTGRKQNFVIYFWCYLTSGCGVN